MRAMVYTSYGSPDVLELADLAKPTPTDDEILIKIHAVSLNGSDRENLIGKPFYTRISGLRRPQKPILGSDIAGRVEAVGKNITEFKPGDAVFGELPDYHGGFAEYVCTHGKTLAHMPESLSFAEAAAIPQAGAIALKAIRERGKVQAGQKVLINGAGGSAGTFAIQIAKLHGAEVTGVDHCQKLEFMRSLGADHVIDYTRESYTKSKGRYDLILDLIARHSVFASQRALAPHGSYLVVGGSTRVLIQTLLFGAGIQRLTTKRMQVLAVPQSRQDLLAITALCEAGQIKPIIDRHYALEELPEAFRYLDQNLAKGKIIINLAEDR